MTGRELIIYILSNNLENTEFFKDDCIIPGFITTDKAAVLCETGRESFRVWAQENDIQILKVGTVELVNENRIKFVRKIHHLTYEEEKHE